MSKFKLFIENFLVYGLGGIISKIVPLIMLPIVTRLMPDTFYFGLNDLSVTVASFGSAIAVMGMYDAMFRMFFEKEDIGLKKDICSTALIFTGFTSLVVFGFLVIFRDWFSQLVFSDVKYKNLLILTGMSILVGATNSIVSAPTRMQNKRIVFLVTNTLGSILSYAISIPLLIKGHYVLALPLASVVLSVCLEVAFFILNKEWFSIKRFNGKYLKELLAIAVPLLPNFLIYWIFNSCDRLMIAKMMGNEFTGIYAIGAKFGQMSQLIYTAFAGGWQYFAFSTMNDGNQVKNNSLVFEYLGVISFAVSVIITELSKPLFQLFFSGAYTEGYVVAPYLFLAPLLQMLFQVACNQFLVIKKTWPNMLILSFGAVVNIIINLTLIPVMGIEGAALATLIGYAVSDIICVIVLCRMRLMVVSKRLLKIVLVMISFMLLWRLVFRDNLFISVTLAVLVLIYYVWLYRREIRMLIRKK